MKACFFGLGSIGQRHLNNYHVVARSMGLKPIVHAMRSSGRKVGEEYNELIDKNFYSFVEIDKDYDIIFITNPTSLHFETLEKCLPLSNHFFIEKPIFDSPRELELTKYKSGLFYVACPLRYTQAISMAKQFIQTNKPVSVRAICSTYLPNWRPNQDYRECYSAKKELGGGVRIDLIHEMDYLVYLFGQPKQIRSLSGKFSQLEIDSEDLAIYIIEFENFLCELHLDYFGKQSKRNLEIITNDGTAVFDILNSCYIKEDGQKVDFEELPNDKYLREMEYFLSCVIKNKKSHNEISLANQILGYTQR